MAFDQRNLDDYIDVAERMTEFYDKYPDGSLRAAVPAKPWELAIVSGTKKDGTETTQTFIVYTALAFRDRNDPAPGVGTAWEIWPGRTPYTLGSELMNAETSAWGRAMAALGIATKRGIASRQEVAARRGEREDGLPVNADGSLSRSRTSDAEKAAAGVMTSGQLAEHTALRPTERGSTRLAAVPADDEWYDAGPGQPLPPLDMESPGTIRPQQQKAIHAAYGNLGVKERAERLDSISKVLGRVIRTTSDLSRGEAGRLLGALEEQQRKGKP